MRRRRDERNGLFKLARLQFQRTLDLRAKLFFFAVIGSLILPTALDSGSQATALQQSQFHPLGGWHPASFLVSAMQTSRYSFQVVSKLRIAAIQPIFTATAYSSFYTFYRQYASTPLNRTVTTDLNLLNASIVYSWGESWSLYSFLTSSAAKQYNITLGQNLSILNDINVSEGALFATNGTRNFDVVILGFSEYVTPAEYLAYKHFVETGGIAIMMDSVTFLAEVAYYPQSQHLALIRGHNWGFNGTAAWRDVFDRWRTNNTNWIASTMWTGYQRGYFGALVVENNPIGRDLRARFGPRIFTSYFGHEENQVTNLTWTSIIASWGIFGIYPNRIVASYLHRYKHSFVIHSGIFTDSPTVMDPSMQYFLARSLLFAAKVASESKEISFYREPSRVLIFTAHLVGLATINGTIYRNASSGSYSYGLASLVANPPPPWRLDHWDTSWGIEVLNPTSHRTTLVITGPGNLTALFTLPNVSTPIQPGTVMMPMLAVLASVLLRKRPRDRLPSSR